jgi:hypothetical protein
MGNNDSLATLIKRQSYLQQEITDVLSQMQLDLESNKNMKEHYENYVSLNSQIQGNAFSLICALKRQVLGAVDLNKAKREAQIKLHWSARPGHWIDPESGESFEKQYGMIMSSFTGTIAEWNNTLIDYCIATGIQRITKKDSESGVVFVHPKVFGLIRTSPLYIGINEGELKGRIGDIDIYVSNSTQEDEVIVISSEKTSAIVTVKDLI